MTSRVSIPHEDFEYVIAEVELFDRRTLFWFGINGGEVTIYGPEGNVIESCFVDALLSPSGIPLSDYEGQYVSDTSDGLEYTLYTDGKTSAVLNNPGHSMSTLPEHWFKYLILSIKDGAYVIHQ